MVQSRLSCPPECDTMASCTQQPKPTKAIVWCSSIRVAIELCPLFLPPLSTSIVTRRPTLQYNVNFLPTILLLIHSHSTHIFQQNYIHPNFRQLLSWFSWTGFFHIMLGGTLVVTTQ